MNQEEIEEFKEEMRLGEALSKAKEFYQKLLIELSIREDNYYIGSGLGGNSSQLFFLLNHNVKIKPSSDDQYHFSRIGSAGVLFEVPAKSNLKQAREELNKFVDSHPDKVSLTRDELLNPDLLKDQKNKTEEVKILIRALEEARALVPWLDMKLDLNKKIDELFRKEDQVVEKAFCKEMNLPLDHFDKDIKDDPYAGMLRSHPVFGAQLKAIGKRQSEMRKQLLSQADHDRLIFLGSCPPYITMFVFRSIVGLERTVALNLDEEKSCEFLTTINKTLNK